MSDEIIWQVINQDFCSYKLKYNPLFLSNSLNYNPKLLSQRIQRLRTIEKNGICYLYMKTAERAHMPSKLWERIKLKANYEQALQQIDDRLLYWPNFLIHRCKQRLTKITQYLIKSRKLAASKQPVLIGIKPKIEKREKSRENKALAAAKLEKAIEKELVERLKSGAYGEMPLNVHEQVWKKVLQQREADTQEITDDEEIDQPDHEEAEFISEDDQSDLEWFIHDQEELNHQSTKRKSQKSINRPRKRVEIEYEEEREAILN
ncbi:Protein mak16 [Neolecta irregularis DAH-3]|uniref:Protein MAK16 n=1 Tax=Neolecta irregularis (strain DAH-3) TaxID=1198029 RepID=A0A1U7LL71_NEOID|nr:Protein mak16 [Neolecta irregularis DAH-3]|eukprot:OLL23405.1 Protein mak16 [Neolecta irregularis DAH-3]